MKLSASVSGDAEAKIKEIFARRGSSNISWLVEAAIVAFSAQPVKDQDRALRRLERARKAVTRDGWLRVFWEELADEFDREDFTIGGHENPYGPRQFGSLTIVLLYDPNSPQAGPIYVHAFENQPTVDNRSLIRDWTFTKDQPSYAAARDVADWVRSNSSVPILPTVAV